ncbi:HUS1 protein, partial [Pseudoatta argentina]
MDAIYMLNYVVKELSKRGKKRSEIEFGKNEMMFEKGRGRMKKKKNGGVEKYIRERMKITIAIKKTWSIRERLFKDDFRRRMKMFDWWKVLHYISLEMPQLKYVRHITDRMKNISSQLIMVANKHGTLIIKIDVDLATVSTHFKGLQVYENEEEQETDDISATINIKKLSMFLSWDILQPDSVKCNLLKEKMVKLTLDVGDYVKIHYFIPAIAS